jgi:hypothetical protein
MLKLASCAVWLGLLLPVGTQFRVLLIEQLPTNLSGHFFLLLRQTSEHPVHSLRVRRALGHFVGLVWC